MRPYDFKARQDSGSSFDDDPESSDRVAYWVGRVGMVLLFLFLFVAHCVYNP